MLLHELTHMYAPLLNSMLMQYELTHTMLMQYELTHTKLMQYEPTHTLLIGLGNEVDPSGLEHLIGPVTLEHA